MVGAAVFAPWLMPHDPFEQSFDGLSLVGAPLPDAEDSRYRARIYRGMSMTV